MTRIFNLGIVVLSLPGLTFGALGRTYARAVGILYVTSSGTGDCSSWANACSLQTALTGAIVGDELWVAAGIYTPTTGTDRSATFQLKNDVAIYGGFAGTETARVQRDPAAHITILSGDLDGNDEDVSNNAENAYHVVTGATGAILDGFTITAGNANGDPPNNQGGGMFNNINSNPTVTNVTFSSNSAEAGGGMYNQNSSPALTNITFSTNSAGDGGGMYNQNSSPTLTNITFNSNSADSYGGGIYNSGSGLILTNVTFGSNSAGSNGGGIYSEYSLLVLTNVTFSANSAIVGGGIYNEDSSLEMHNTILWGNTANYNEAQIENNNSYSSIYDSIMQGGCHGGTVCKNISTTDPLLGTLANYGGFTQTFPLLPHSSAINTGNDTNCPAGDQRGVVRPQSMHCDIGAYEYSGTVVLDTQIVSHSRNPGYSSEPNFTFSGSSSVGGAIVFECSLDGAAFIGCVSPKSYTGLLNGPHTLSVRAKGISGIVDTTPAFYAWTMAVHVTYATPAGTGDCSSWANACTLQTALTKAVGGNEIWVASGTYKPTTGTDRNAAFQLKDGVAVYGGFTGTETKRVQRDPAANLTILSGDLNGDDVGFANNVENVNHVVIGATGATLDGFIVTAGNASNASKNSTNGSNGGRMYNHNSRLTLANVAFSIKTATVYSDTGGGIYNYKSNPILTNVVISGNSAISFGGGMYNNNSNPMLTNVTFRGNSAGSGGGMYNDKSNPTLMNVTFSSNSAMEYYGGGMYNINSSPTLTNVTFRGNSATADGGGMDNIQSSPILTNVIFGSNTAMNYGGGMGNWISDPVLTNVTFDNNTADQYGGGMGNSYSTPMLTNVTFNANSSDTFGGGMGNNTSSPVLTNVTFHSNTAAKYGGGMGNLGGSNPALTNVTFSLNSAHEGGGMYNAYISNPQIHNTIFWSNTALDGGAQIYNYERSIPSVNNSVVQSGCPAGSACTNIITIDPLLGMLESYGRFTQTIPLLAGSSALDTGNDATCAATDQRGISRPQGAHCDIGAFELVVIRK